MQARDCRDLRRALDNLVVTAGDLLKLLDEIEHASYSCLKPNRVEASPNEVEVEVDERDAPDDKSGWRPNV